jgi:hypothetical protein
MGAAGIERHVANLASELLEVFDLLGLGDRLPDETMRTQEPATGETAEHGTESALERAGTDELEDDMEVVRQQDRSQGLRECGSQAGPCESSGFEPEKRSQPAERVRRDMEEHALCSCKTAAILRTDSRRGAYNTPSPSVKADVSASPALTSSPMGAASSCPRNRTHVRLAGQRDSHRRGKHALENRRQTAILRGMGRHPPPKRRLAAISGGMSSPGAVFGWGVACTADGGRAGWREEAPMATFPCPFCNAPLQVEPFGPRFCPACGDNLVFGGRFVLTERLGSGGMSVVYGARSETGERAAVKILTLQTAKEWNVLDLFDHGAQVLMGVRHPGLPVVYDLSQDQKGRHVLVREAFGGGTLEERVLREGRHLEPAAFDRLFEALLNIVGYLHGLVPPVLHRDIKPSNIMFRTGADWNPVLVDFDTVALPPERRSGLTVVGTPGYAAPEQFYGESVPQSDLFGLGATMLCVATHTDVNLLPRAGGRFQVEGRLDNVDPRARQVMQRLLEPDPARRYQTAAEALWELRGSGPVRAAPPPHAPALGPKRGLIAVIAAAALLLVLGGFGGAAFFMMRPSVPSPITPVPVVTPAPPPVPDPPLAPDPPPVPDRPQRIQETIAAEEAKARAAQEDARREREKAAEAAKKQAGLGLCKLAVPCYVEAEESGQVAGKLEVTIDASGKVTKAAYSGGKAPAKVRKCLEKVGKAVEVPEWVERPAVHHCQWAGTVMGRSSSMMFSSGVKPKGK